MRGSEESSGTGSPDSVEVGHQDAAVAERDFQGLARRALVNPYGQISHPRMALRGEGDYEVCFG